MVQYHEYSSSILFECVIYVVTFSCDVKDVKQTVKNNVRIIFSAENAISWNTSYIYFESTWNVTDLLTVRGVINVLMSEYRYLIIILLKQKQKVLYSKITCNKYSC